MALQLRHKRLPLPELASLGRELRRLTRERGVPLLINTDLALALELDADGAHLPDGADIAAARTTLGLQAVLGASCHDAASLAAAADQGASFATLSPLHTVPGKAPPLGLQRFRSLAAEARVPVLALGGIDESNAIDALDAGASGVAVSRAVFAARDPAHALSSLAKTVARADSTTACHADRGSMR